MTINEVERQQRLRERMHSLFEEYVAAEKELTRLEENRFRVCIFGSARIGRADPTYQMVRKLARTLGRLGIDIVTGGGPGLMDAANHGLQEAHVEGSQSIGLPILLPNRSEAANKHLDIKSEHSRFSSRLDEFMRLSHAVIVAPGGIGTLLELSYTWQLMQVHMIEPRATVLLGREFWGGLLEWMRDQQVRRQFVAPCDLDYVHVADTQAEVLDLIKPELEKFRAQKHECGDYSQAHHADAILKEVGAAQGEPEHHEPLPGATARQ